MSGMNRAFSLVVAAMAIAACSNAGPREKCDCATPRVELTIAGDLAVSAQSPVLTGPGCASSTADCEQPLGAGGCARYAFTPAAAGACHVQISFADGTFDRDLTFVSNGGCCPGAYPDPASAGQIEVDRVTDGGAG